MNFNTDRDVFVADRRNLLERADASLAGVVEAALEDYGTTDWYAPIVAKAADIFQQVFAAEAGQPTGPNYADDLSTFEDDLSQSLRQTTFPDGNTPARIYRWISTAAINAATYAAGVTEDAEVGMEWVTMHDTEVRETHEEVDGQTVPLGVEFTVGGEKMRYPGDPRVSIELWINCRCVLAPTLVGPTPILTAAAKAGDIGNDGAVIVALPAGDDPIHDISSQSPHVTLVWLGKVAEIAPLVRGQIDRDVSAIARKQEPVTERVNGHGTLGEDDASIAMLDAHGLAPVRDALLGMDDTRRQFDLVEQYPAWIPHLTLGYPEAPPLSDVIPDQVVFDSLGLWLGDERTVYPMGEAMTASVNFEVEDDEEPAPITDEDIEMEPLRWHAVLLAEGVLSGDNRMFTEGALRWRDLPLPLSWQKQTADGHDGSVVVGRIDEIWREGGLIKAEGVFAASPEADEAAGQIAEQLIRGVSVDVDDSTMEVMARDGDTVVEMTEDDERPPVAQFTDGRICGTTMCAIPAFAEAFIALGPWEGTEVELQETGEEGEEDFSQTFVSDKPWSNFKESDYTPQQWKSACCLHRSQELEPKSNHGLPVKEPGGALNKNGVHAAAARFNQVSAPTAAKAAAKSCLRGAYSTIGEEPPDVLKASGEFKRGPGWVTHPEETRRIHAYWTKGKGAAKIRWGQPGDFNRCRKQLAKYVRTDLLNQVCAQWHHDAIGVWPGQEGGKKGRHSGETATAPAVVLTDPVCLDCTDSLVASISADWFGNPELLGPSPVVVTSEGRVFGHLATWETCHIGFGDVCVTAPHSVADYAYFKTGAVLTDGGEISVGQITMNTGHANTSYGARKTVAHYDDTGTVVADVNIGEDTHGIWVAGKVRDGVGDDAVAALRAAALSGDWRRIKGSLELVAALAVNTPGFPIPRTSLAASGARQTALVAASLVPPEHPTADDIHPIALAVIEEIKQIEIRRERIAAIRKDVNRMRMAALAASVEGN